VGRLRRLVASAAMSATGKWVLARTAVLAGAAVLALSSTALAQQPARSSSCDIDSGSGAPSSNGEMLPAELSSPLEEVILTRFAVFRRGALAGDRFPALSPVGIEVDNQLARYYPSYVRQVKVLPNGGRYFVIPGYARPLRIPPVRCLPASLRRDRTTLLEQEHKLASEPVYCVVEIGSDSGPGTCESFAQIEESPRIFEPILTEEAIVELVPDGVASVRATYAIGPPLVVTTAENIYTLAPPRDVRRREQRAVHKLADRPEHDKHPTKAQQRRSLDAFVEGLDKAAAEATPRKLEWLGSAGELVRSIARPSATSAYLADGAPIELLE
jgi:hypothetical protein